jgi:RimJ/RimL family protein N-acetyltransferase
MGLAIAPVVELQPESVGKPYAGRVVTLRSGIAVRLRPIAPDDAPGLIALSRRLSPRTIYQRFFTVRELRPEDAAALSSVDGHDRVAMVADRGPGGPDDLIGVARYGVAGDDPAPDIGVVVDDAWQGQGLGSILLNELLYVGEAQGFVTFRADVLAENRRMLRLLARYGTILQRSAEDGVVTLVFRRRPEPLAPSTPADSSSLGPAVRSRSHESRPADVR